MLFSEPKIPQPSELHRLLHRRKRFQCSSASRKFLNPQQDESNAGEVFVSVLFSEPKIPQPMKLSRNKTKVTRFSALQRAENSSTLISLSKIGLRQRFQCSSASRKFLNNKSAQSGITPDKFQCSSASRKFLNRTARSARARPRRSFSALQRAENSSTFALQHLRSNSDYVSVLFSEPKIPQPCNAITTLQRSSLFQCSSASRKFLNHRPSHLLPSVFSTAMIALRRS